MHPQQASWVSVWHNSMKPGFDPSSTTAGGVTLSKCCHFSERLFPCEWNVTNDTNPVGLLDNLCCVPSLVPGIESFNNWELLLLLLFCYSLEKHFVNEKSRRVNERMQIKALGTLRKSMVSSWLLLVLQCKHYEQFFIRTSVDFDNSLHPGSRKLREQRIHIYLPPFQSTWGLVHRINFFGNE